MLKPTSKSRVLFVRRCLPALLVLFGVFCLFVVNLRTVGIVSASTASSTMNFQARLQTASGAIVPDGSYNIEFKLYSVSSSGTALWTEDYLNSSSNGLKTVNGYLSANLGSITAFPSTIDWSQQLYLTMNVGGTTTGSATWDGEMNPRLPLTAVPYAFQSASATKASQLSTTSGSNTSTLSIQAPTGGSQTFVIQDQGASGTYTLLTGGTSGSGVQLQSSTPGTAQTGSFNVSGTGIVGSLQSASLDTTSAGTLNIGTSTATTIAIGGGTSAQTLSIGNGSGNDTVNIATGTGTDAINIGSTGDTTTISGTVNLGSSAGGGTVITNNGATINSVLALANFASGGSIGTAATTVDLYSAISIAQTTTGQTLTLPTPTASTGYGRLLYVTNVGTAPFTLLGTPLNAGASATLLWSNTNSTASWVYSGADGNSILNQSSSTQSGNFNIMAGTGTVAAKIQGASSQDILDIYTSAGTKADYFDSTGKFYTTGGISSTSYATISAGSGASSTSTVYIVLNDNNTSSTNVTPAGIDLTITGTANTSGTNTSYGIRLNSVTAATNNTYYGISVGTGYSDILRYNGTQLISGTGVLQSVALSGTYSNALTLSNTSNIYTGASSTVSGTAKAATVNATSGYQLNGTAGSTTTCSSGNVLSNIVVQGGIVTAGTCITSGAAAPTLQNVYDNSSSTPLITLTTTGKGVTIKDASTSVGGNLFAIQNNGATSNYFAVTTSGVSAAGTATFGGLLTANAGTTITGAMTVSGGAISLAGNAASSLTTSSGALTLTSAAAATWSTTAGVLTVQGAGGVSVDSSAAGQSLTIGNSAVTHTIAVGTGAAAQTVTVGSTNTTSTLTLQAGSGGVNISGATTVTGALSGSTTVNAVSGYKFNGTAGSTTTCTSSNYLSNIVVQGGIITGGTCTAVAAAGVTTVGTLDGGTANSTGATISGTTLYLQSASINYAGLINTTAQSILGVKTFNSGVTIGVSAGSGTVFTNYGATVNSVLALTNFATGGSIGTAATTVDLYTAISVAQTTTGQTLTLPTPTASTSYGRVLYISNVGTAAFTLLGTPLNAGASATLLWSNTNGGASWAYSGADGNSILNQSASTQTGNFKISGTGTAASLQASSFDTASTTALSIASTNASSIVIGNTTSNVQTTINGNVVIKPTAGNDSSYDVQLQNAAGTSLFVADTTKMAITTAVGAINVSGVSNPTVPTLTTATSGGSLSAGTYYYKLAAQGTTGKYTMAITSSPGSVTTTGSTSKNTLSWSAVTVAQGYVVYRSTNGTTWYSNTVSASTTSLVDDGSTYTWTTTVTPPTSNGTGGVNLQKGTSITLDAGSGNYQSSIYYQTSSESLVAANYNTSGGIILQSDSFMIQDTTGYNSNLLISNTGATLFENRVNSTSAFQIQNASGVSQLNVDTTTGTITMGTATNGVIYTASGGLVATGTAQHAKTITLTPEYAGAVLDATNDATCVSATNGTMTSGYDTTQSYYKWVSNASAQCYDVVVRVPLPSDFSSWASSTPISVKTYSTNVSTGTVAIDAKDTSNTAETGCAYAAATPASTSTWTNMGGSCVLAGTYTADGVMTLRIRMTGAVSSDVRISNIVLSYKSKF